MADAAGASTLLRLGSVVVGVSLGDGQSAVGFIHPRPLPRMTKGGRGGGGGGTWRKNVYLLAEPGNVALPEGVNLTRRHADVAHLVLGNAAAVNGAEQGGAESEDAGELHGGGCGSLDWEVGKVCVGRLKQVWLILIVLRMLDASSSLQRA